MSSISSDSSGEGGNTKPPRSQVSASLGWCFTLHKVTKTGKSLTDDMISSISSKIKDLCSKACMSHETGSADETPHIQGYIKFKDKKRPFEIFKPICDWISWRKAKGTPEQNLSYISKENDPFFLLGFPKPVKTITPDYGWEKHILNIIATEPDDRTIYWFWSRNGGTGKTSFCKYLSVHHSAIALSGKASDMRNGVIDYVKTNGHTPELILIPIPRSFNTDYLSYEGIENIKDMYFYSGKYEGGMVCGNCPHVIVFANEEPDVEKMSRDRWRVFEI